MDWIKDVGLETADVTAIDLGSPENVAAKTTGEAEEATNDGGAGGDGATVVNLCESGSAILTTISFWFVA